MNKLVFASVVSEIQQSEIFMTVKARICEAPAANLNGVRVTEAFIDDIVGNEERYVGLPLYADVKALTSGNYRRLGHLYDARTGEFHSTQIGSFYQFEKEPFENEAGEKGCYLVGYARIAKRNKKLQKAICELFAEEALKFSFELNVGEYEELDDETILIDAAESNYLEGTAIVTFPACENATAVEFVAQREADEPTEGGETEMAGENIKTAEVIQEPEKEVAETVEPETEVNTEVEIAEETVEQPEATEEPVEEVQTAAVIIRESNVQCTNVDAYDTETGVEARQHVVVETEVVHVDQEASIVEADDGIHIAEETVEDAPVEEAEAPEETEEASEEAPEAPAEEEAPANAEQPTDLPAPDASESKKTAEQLIAELAEVVEGLKNEIAELKTQKVTAEAKPVTAEINPLMADINSNGSYSLLEKEDEKKPSYSLLSK